MMKTLIKNYYIKEKHYSDQLMSTEPMSLVSKQQDPYNDADEQLYMW